MVTRVNASSSVGGAPEVNPTQRAPLTGLSDVSSTIQDARGDVTGSSEGFCAWIGRMVTQLWDAIKRCCYRRNEAISHEAPAAIRRETRIAKGSGFIDSHFARCQEHILQGGYRSFGMTVSIKYSNGTSNEVGNSGRAFSTAAELNAFKQECQQSLRTLIERDNNRGLNGGGLWIETRLVVRDPDRRLRIHCVDNSIQFSDGARGTASDSTQVISQAELDQNHHLFFPERRGFEWSRFKTAQPALRFEVQKDGMTQRIENIRDLCGYLIFKPQSPREESLEES